MNKSTSNQIDALISESGLFSKKQFKSKDIEVFDFQDEIILVTGAAGSIGSELSKQLINSKYKKIVLVDIAESPLYELQKDLEHLGANNIECSLINITDTAALECLFKTHKPTLIFHTAAYKHVPLMEKHPYEAVKTNIFGTKILADLSIKNNVNKFIFISTDKAANPINTMGMSKYIAECYLNSLSEKTETDFIITRFGNIFGSSGSVVPLFKKQIEAGKPIIITSSQVSRYFINKHKACNLILKIVVFEKQESNVFTFNMGNPIKISDLAKKIIDLETYRNNVIDIDVTNLREGEKLHENMISDDEILSKTSHGDILKITTNSNRKFINFDALEKITPFIKPSEIKSILKSYL